TPSAWRSSTRAARARARRMPTSSRPAASVTRGRSPTSSASSPPIAPDTYPGPSFRSTAACPTSCSRILRLRKHLSPVPVLVTGALLAGITFLVLWIAPSDHYLLLPDKAHPVAPLVTLKGEKPDRGPGGIYFVDVIERKATLLERLFPEIRDGSTLV